MKRILCLSLSLALFLTACGGGSTSTYEEVYEIIVTSDNQDSSTQSEQNTSLENTTSQTASDTLTSIESAQDLPTTSTHPHTFADATCTEPKKCDCGETQGEPQGHDYQNGACSVCNATDPDVAVLTNLSEKLGNWSYSYVYDGQLYVSTIDLSNPATFAVINYLLYNPFERIAQEEHQALRQEGSDKYVVFNGKEYYISRSGSDFAESFSINGDYVFLNDLDGERLTLQRTGENTMVVVSSPANFLSLGRIPVDTVFTYVSK